MNFSSVHADMSRRSAKSRQDIYAWVDWQIRQRLYTKYRFGKSKWSPRKALARSVKIIKYALWGARFTIPRGSRSIELGVDEFGRSVADGLEFYLKMIRGRGFKVRTAIVLGSRVKGTWRPESDLDLLLVLQSDSGGDKKIPSEDPLCMSIQPEFCYAIELMHWIDECRLTVLDAMYWGLLAFDDGFWSEAKKAFSDIERKYDLPKDELCRRLAEI
jgi:hypothetical protein